MELCFMPQEVAEKIVLDSDTALISIIDPETASKKNHQYRVLLLSFHSS